MAGEAPRDYEWQEAMVIPGPKGQEEGPDVYSYERGDDRQEIWPSIGAHNHCQNTQQPRHSNTPNSDLLLMISISQIQPEARG